MRLRIVLLGLLFASGVVAGPAAAASPWDGGLSVTSEGEAAFSSVASEITADSSRLLGKR